MSSTGQCVAIVSGKGGTGKTSCTAGVGAALALAGKRVLCLDCDVGLRNLDLALAMSDRALMDFTDVVQGRCDLLSAAAEHPRIRGLFLLTAPTRERGRPVEEEQMQALLTEVRSSFDFCLLDAPAGLGHGFALATCGADRVIVVTTTDAASLRDAQHTVMELRETLPVHLVVNRVRRRLLRSMHATIDDAMDAAGLPLLGVVPEDDALPLCASRSEPLLLGKPRSAAACAYRNIAARLLGEHVSLIRVR